MEKSWHLFERNKELVLPDQIPRTTRTREGKGGPVRPGLLESLFHKSEHHQGKRQSLGFVFRFFSSKKDHENIFEQLCFPNFAFPMHPIESLQ